MADTHIIGIDDLGIARSLCRRVHADPRLSTTDPTCPDCRRLARRKPSRLSDCPLHRDRSCIDESCCQCLYVAHKACNLWKDPSPRPRVGSHVKPGPGQLGMLGVPDVK